KVAYVQTEIDEKEDQNVSTIWVVSTDGSEPVQFTRGPKRDTAPRWSPDGTRLAFLSDREGKHAQLYVMPATGGEPRKLTSLERGAGPAVWSPDGQTLVFESRVPERPAPKEESQRRQWEQRPKVITRAQYKADGEGYILDARTHLFLIPANGSRDPQQLTDGDAEDRAPVWSPDGSSIAFTRTRGGSTEYSLSDVWTLQITWEADGRALAGNLRCCTAEPGRAISPSWSPNGQTIACYGTDEALPGAGDPMHRVWLVPAGGGQAERAAPNFDRTAVFLPPPANTPGPAWSPDGTNVTFMAADAGNIHIVRAHIDSGTVEPLITGERQVTSASFAAGKIAFSATDGLKPADVYVTGDGSTGERRLTRVNDALLREVRMPQVERRTFDSPNGGTVDGWLYRPPEASGATPLLLHIHGGPHSYVGNGFYPSAMHLYVLAARGWSVLALNFTGSGSYTKDFACALRGRWGEHDLPEHLAAIDTLVAEGSVDGDRLAVAGYSYGGYMT
ncbi:MAG TPA: prolyl oligopeptidase family serine peptidase, partial [Chloroflexota bacterium]|nr:prolyl oligopeptidase family serine peptidase [Chloroflexota bacterium]